MTTDKEQFVCLNCHFVGELDTNLRCSKCESEAVLSKNQLEVTMKALASTSIKSQALAPTSKPRRWYRLRYGLFETFVSNYRSHFDPQEALRIASHPQYEWNPVSQLDTALLQLTELADKEFTAYLGSKFGNYFTPEKETEVLANQQVSQVTEEPELDKPTGL